MAMSFRDAFLDALASTGDNPAGVAKGSGVSESHLKTLQQHPDTQTNVDDAQKIAAYFGVGLDAFLDDPALQAPIEIVALYNQLPEPLKRQFLAYAQALPAQQDRSEPE